MPVFISCCRVWVLKNTSCFIDFSSGSSLFCLLWCLIKKRDNVKSYSSGKVSSYSKQWVMSGEKRGSSHDTSASDLKANQNTHWGHQLITSHSIVCAELLGADYEFISSLRPHCLSPRLWELVRKRARALSGQPDIRCHFCYVTDVMSCVVLLSWVVPFFMQSGICASWHATFMQIWR